MREWLSTSCEDESFGLDFIEATGSSPLLINVDKCAIYLYSHELEQIYHLQTLELSFVTFVMEKVVKDTLEILITFAISHFAKG